MALKTWEIPGKTTRASCGWNHPKSHELRRKAGFDATLLELQEIGNAVMLVGKSQMRQNSRTPVTTNPHISYDLVSTQLPIYMTSHRFSCGMREKKWLTGLVLQLPANIMEGSTLVGVQMRSRPITITWPEQDLIHWAWVVWPLNQMSSTSEANMILSWQLARHLCNTNAIYPAHLIHLILYGNLCNLHPYLYLCIDMYSLSGAHWETCHTPLIGWWAVTANTRRAPLSLADICH